MNEQLTRAAIAAAAIALFCLVSVYAATNREEARRAAAETGVSMADATAGGAYLPRRWDSRSADRHRDPVPPAGRALASKTAQPLY